MAALATAELSLDQRLVEIGLELLSSEGIEALTLRRLAREAGVSHGAPLRHFPSLAALRSEIAARGFTMLSQAVERESEALPPGSGALARLRAAGHGYARLALARPSLFALMFRPDLLDRENPRFLQEATTAYGHLLRLVQAAQDTGWHPEHDTSVLASSVWSAIHGFASLWGQGSFQGPAASMDFEDALDTTLTLVLGHQPQGET